MIPEEFAKEVFNRWPYKGAKSEEELKVIAADITAFANGRTEAILQPILDEYIAMKPPKDFGMWWFWKRVERPKTGKIYWRVCDNGHLYDDRGSCCPVCGCYYFKLDTGPAKPMDVIQVQESCCVCKWYKQNMTELVHGLDGPECGLYGTDKTGTLLECEQCKCKGCCNMAYLYEHNPVKYRHLADKKLKEKYAESGIEETLNRAEKKSKLTGNR